MSDAGDPTNVDRLSSLRPVPDDGWFRSPGDRLRGPGTGKGLEDTEFFDGPRVQRGALWSADRFAAVQHARRQDWAPAGADRSNNLFLGAYLSDSPRG